MLQFWLETNPTCRSLATQTDETLVSGSHLQEDRSGNHRIPVKTEIGYGLVDQLTDTGGYIRTDRFGILMFSKNSLVFDDGFINETCGSDPVVKAMLKRRADGTYKISRAGDVLFDGYLEVNQTVRYEKMVEPCNQFRYLFI